MTGRNGDSWFQCHRWSPNDTTGYGIDDDDDDDDDNDDGGGGGGDDECCSFIQTSCQHTVHGAMVC